MNNFVTDFEPVYAALFDLLEGTRCFVTVGRMLKHWTEVTSQQQPAMFMSQVDEDVTKRPRQAPKWELHVQLFVYCMGPDQDTTPATVMNPLLGKIRQVLAAPLNDPNFSQTLGGLVMDAYIDGKIETDEGLLEQQAVARIPVTIIVN